jgi:hypothetical protein
MATRTIPVQTPSLLCSTRRKANQFCCHDQNPRGVGSCLSDPLSQTDAPLLTGELRQSHGQRWLALVHLVQRTVLARPQPQPRTWPIMVCRLDGAFKPGASNAPLRAARSATPGLLLIYGSASHRRRGIPSLMPRADGRGPSNTGHSLCACWTRSPSIALLAPEGRYEGRVLSMSKLAP